MPTTSLTYTNEFLSTTAIAHLKEMRNMVDKPRPFVDDFMKDRSGDLEGGERITVRWRTNRHSQTTRLSTGYEPVNLTVRPLGTPGHDDWAYVVRPVLISKRDTTLNRGPHLITSILKERVQDTEDGLREEIHNVFWRGSAAGGTYAGEPTMADFNTFNGADDTTGFIETAGVGAQSNTVHNVSKASFATLPGFQNQRFDGAGSFSTNGLNGLQAITTRINFLKQSGSKLMGYCSLEAQDNLKQSLFSVERFMSKDALDAGRQALVYAGIALTPDDNLPNSGLNTATAPWSIVIVDFGAVKFCGQKGMVMNMTPFENLPGTAGVRAATLELFGQVINQYFGTHGVLFDADAF